MAVQRGVVKGSNQEGPGGDKRNNGFMGLGGSGSTVHPANQAMGGDRRNGSFPLGGRAPAIQRNAERFNVDQVGMPDQPFPDEPGKGAVPVNPFLPGGSCGSVSAGFGYGASEVTANADRMNAIASSWSNAEFLYRSVACCWSQRFFGSLHELPAVGGGLCEQRHDLLEQVFNVFGHGAEYSKWLTPRKPIKPPTSWPPSVPGGTGLPAWCSGGCPMRWPMPQLATCRRPKPGCRNCTVHWPGMSPMPGAISTARPSASTSRPWTRRCTSSGWGRRPTGKRRRRDAQIMGRSYDVDFRDLVEDARAALQSAGLAEQSSGPDAPYLQNWATEHAAADHGPGEPELSDSHNCDLRSGWTDSHKARTPIM